jgi:hypothetical protein
MARERSKPRNASWWSAQIGAWESSDLTQSEFCRVHGLSLASFSNWRARFKAQSTGIIDPTGLVKKQRTAQFVAVEIPISTPLVRVSLGAVTVDFETLPPPAWVAELASYGGR